MPLNIVDLLAILPFLLEVLLGIFGLGGEKIRQVRFVTRLSTRLKDSAHLSTFAVISYGHESTQMSTSHDERQQRKYSSEQDSAKTVFNVLFFAMALTGRARPQSFTDGRC